MSANPNDENTTTTPAELPGQIPSQTIYKVPRRFDLTTMFVVTTVFAALLGMLSALGVPGVVQVSLVGLLSLVGAVQIATPARYVRWAAVACGWVVSGVALIVTYSQSRYPPDPDEIVGGILCGVLIWGSLFGYIAGVVVAGLFLVADHVRHGAVRALGRED